MKENRGDDILEAIGQSEQAMRSPSWRFKKKGLTVKLARFRNETFELDHKGSTLLLTHEDMIIGEMDYRPKQQSKSRRLLEGMKGLENFFTALHKRREKGKVTPQLLLVDAVEYHPGEKMLERLGFYGFSRLSSLEAFGYLSGRIASVATLETNVKQVKQELKEKRIGGKTVYERLKERAKRNSSL
jgi:hypothetical protein